MKLLIIDDLPAALEQHLQVFLTQRPGWTQARMMQSALSLFLLQNGVNDRAVSQAYLQAMFGEQAIGEQAIGEQTGQGGAL